MRDEVLRLMDVKCNPATFPPFDSWRTCMLQDVARTLIDTLGAIACAAADLPSPLDNANGGYSETTSSSGDRSSQAFSLAVSKLCSMCAGEKTEAGDWALLGLPLRSARASS